MSKEHVVVVGAGLCGTLLAMRMAQRGYRVSLYEKRSDMRSREVEAGRSINLALSDRGFKALRLVGLEDQIRDEVIPMYGRFIHPLNGDPRLSRYSGREGEHINSVSRAGLNMALLDAADSFNNLTIFFEHNCFGVSPETGTARFGRPEGQIVEVEADVIFGTDGAGSAVRRSLFDRTAQLRFDYSQDFLDHGYKELVIPPAENGGWRIDKNALHIWPRQEYMLIALANLDGSFTVTLFFPFDGKPGFNQLDTTEKIHDFFGKVFPTAKQHMPTLVRDFEHNPTGILGTIKCFPWQANGNVLILGDAAHAVVPFYGQGMNCSLEDVVVLDKCMDEYDGNWSRVLPAYQERRKKDADAIGDLAVENYYEMRDHVDNPEFVRKRELEMLLERNYPDYSSKYNLVTFNEEVPYSVAKERGHRQDAFLLEFCRENEDVEAVDLGALFESLQSL